MKHYVTEKTTTFNVAAFQGANTSCVADRAVFARSIDVKFHSSIKLFYSQTVQAPNKCFKRNVREGTPNLAMEEPKRNAPS